MAKPTDFFVGVTDLFSVILPGACIAFVGKEAMELCKCQQWGLDRNQSYVVFFVVAYLLGHLMDYGGSKVWDPLYDRAYARRKRKAAVREEAKRLKEVGWVEEPASGVAERPLVAGDPLLNEASRLAKGLMPVGDKVFQWSRAWICLKNPGGFIEIERLQANSKFFRGLVSVFLITTVVLLAARHCVEDFSGWGATICFVLAGVSFLRFCDLRWKAVQQTYRFFILMHTEPLIPAMGEAGKPESEESPQKSEED